MRPYLARMVRDNITLPMRRASGSGWFEETVKAGLIATVWLKTGGRGHRALLVTAETELPWIRAGTWSTETKAMANLWVGGWI